MVTTCPNTIKCPLVLFFNDSKLLSLQATWGWWGGGGDVCYDVSITGSPVFLKEDARDPLRGH